MAGRKIIPLEIKKARGTYRADRDRHSPGPSKNKPLPPAWLNARAKKIFWHMAGRLNEIGLASRTHTEMLALLASRMEEVEKFDRMLNEGGVSRHVYTTKNINGEKILKEHPAVVLREKAARHVQSLLAEFGLSPAAAQKVGTPKKKEKKNEFSDF